MKELLRGALLLVIGGTVLALSWLAVPQCVLLWLPVIAGLGLMICGASLALEEIFRHFPSWSEEDDCQ